LHMTCVIEHDMIIAYNRNSLDGITALRSSWSLKARTVI